jgi:hypothetical protein
MLNIKIFSWGFFKTYFYVEILKWEFTYYVKIFWLHNNGKRINWLDLYIKDTMKIWTEIESRLKSYLNLELFVVFFFRK